MKDTQFSVCVYCGSRNGTAPVYAQVATELGAEIARRGWRLVYGAGDVGLMGRVATSAMAGGAETLGVIPTHLLDLEVGKRDITSLVITETMHERKKVMFMNADAIVVLPGGAGSLDEFFEVLTWAQLKLHTKPIILLSVDGYWKPLVTLIEHVIEQGFADQSLRDLFRVAEDLDAAVAALSAV